MRTTVITTVAGQPRAPRAPASVVAGRGPPRRGGHGGRGGGSLPRDLWRVGRRDRGPGAARWSSAGTGAQRRRTASPHGGRGAARVPRRRLPARPRAARAIRRRSRLSGCGCPSLWPGGVSAARSGRRLSIARSSRARISSSCSARPARERTAARRRPHALLDPVVCHNRLHVATDRRVLRGLRRLRRRGHRLRAARPSRRRGALLGRGAPGRTTSITRSRVRRFATSTTSCATRRSSIAAGAGGPWVAGWRHSRSEASRATRPTAGRRSPLDRRPGAAERAAEGVDEAARRGPPAAVGCLGHRGAAGEQHHRLEHPQARAPLRVRHAELLAEEPRERALAGADAAASASRGRVCRGRRRRARRRRQARVARRGQRDRLLGRPPQLIADHGADAAGLGRGQRLVGARDQQLAQERADGDHGRARGCRAARSSKATLWNALAP